MKITQDALNYITLFERRTGAQVKDCIPENDLITFIVKKGDVGAAIGKNGSIVNKIKEEIGKEIHIYEHSDDPKQFIQNLLYPAKIKSIEINNDEMKVFMGREDKKRAIGKGGKKINTAKELLKRHSNIKEVKIY